jgi:hypothetical protein
MFFRFNHNDFKKVLQMILLRPKKHGRVGKKSGAAACVIDRKKKRVEKLYHAAAALRPFPASAHRHTFFNPPFTRPSPGSVSPFHVSTPHASPRPRADAAGLTLVMVQKQSDPRHAERATRWPTP